MQQILLPALAAIARRRGLEQTIERYLDIDTHPSAERGLGQLPARIMVRTDETRAGAPGRRPPQTETDRPVPP